MAGQIVGILLAAGSGSRFGSDKLLHLLPSGMPMAVAAAAHLLPACDRVIAVLRPRSEKLVGRLAAIGCETVVCDAAEAGMGHSLAAGVSASREATGWVVALADMPFIVPATHRVIVSSLRSGASIAACEYMGRRGHPVGFAACWRDQLIALAGDQGGKALLQAHREAVMICPVDDPGVVWDIDRPEDMANTTSF